MLRYPVTTGCEVFAIPPARSPALVAVGTLKLAERLPTPPPFRPPLDDAKKPWLLMPVPPAARPPLLKTESPTLPVPAPPARSPPEPLKVATPTPEVGMRYSTSKRASWVAQNTSAVSRDESQARCQRANRVAGFWACRRSEGFKRAGETGLSGERGGGQAEVMIGGIIER